MKKIVTKMLPFGFEKPEDSLGFCWWQTTMAWQRAIKKELELYEVSHPQFVIMAILLWCDNAGFETTQVIIIQWTNLDKMTVSASLKKLVARGLVHRMEHQVDTRSKVSILTEQGKALIYKLVPLVEAVDTRFFGKVSVDEQQSLLSILVKLQGCTAE